MVMESLILLLEVNLEKPPSFMEAEISLQNLIWAILMEQMVL